MSNPPSASLFDTDFPSFFHYPTVDIADRLQSMLETERRSQYQCRDYLYHHRRQSRRFSAPSSTFSSKAKVENSIVAANNTNIVTPALRTKIVQWLYDCVDYLELSRESVAMAMSYVDRIMSNSSRTMPAAAIVAQAKQDSMMYQLVAVSSLFLAAKQNSSHHVRSSSSSPIDACTLVRISHDSYSANEIIQMEKVVLEGLEWRLCGPTALSIAYDAIALLAKTLPSQPDKWRRVSSVLDFTRLQIEMSILDYNSSVLRSPSTIAMASIVNAMELLDFTSREKHAFSRILKKLLIFQEDIFQSPQVDKARAELHNVFDWQSSNVIDRAILGLSALTKEVLEEKEERKKKEEKEKTTTMKNNNLRRSKSTSPSKSPVRVDSDILVLDIAKTKRSHSRNQLKGHRSASYSHRRRKTDPGMNPVMVRRNDNMRRNDNRRRVPLEP